MHRLDRKAGISTVRACDSVPLCEEEGEVVSGDFISRSRRVCADWPVWERSREVGLGWPLFGSSSRLKRGVSCGATWRKLGAAPGGAPCWLARPEKAAKEEAGELRELADACGSSVDCDCRLLNSSSNFILGAQLESRDESEFKQSTNTRRRESLMRCAHTDDQ